MQDALKRHSRQQHAGFQRHDGSAGVLFKTIGSAFASSPPPGCTPGTGPDATCYGPNAPVNDQPAGLVTMEHSPNLLAALPAAGPIPRGIDCPGLSSVLFGPTYSANHDGDCRRYSKPLMVNDLFWQNRAFHITVSGPGSNLESQQNLVTLVPTLNQTVTGECASGATYWDVGVRGDTSSTNRRTSLHPAARRTRPSA